MRRIPGQSSGLQLATLLTAAQTNKASQDTAHAGEGFVFHCSVFMFLVVYSQKTVFCSHDGVSCYCRFCSLESVHACERRLVSPPPSHLNRPFHQQSPDKQLPAVAAQQLNNGVCSRAAGCKIPAWNGRSKVTGSFRLMCKIIEFKRVKDIEMNQKCFYTKANDTSQEVSSPIMSKVQTHQPSHANPRPFAFPCRSSFESQI